MNMGTLSPNPWDLSLSGKNGCLDSASLNLGRPPLAGAGQARNQRGAASNARRFHSRG